MPNPTLSAFLAAEHEALTPLFERARAVGCADDGEAFAAFHSSLTRQLGIEEHVLFVSIEERLGEGSPVVALHAQHERIRALLARAAQERSFSSPAGLETALQNLGELVSQHHQTEEEALSPLVDTLFGDDTENVVEAMEAMAGINY